MAPIEDFFAFDDDFNQPDQEKKKKKKKTKKSKPASGTTNSVRPKLENSNKKRDVMDLKNLVNLEPETKVKSGNMGAKSTPTDNSVSIEKDSKDEDTLTNLLGLSGSILLSESPAASTPISVRDNTPTTIINTNRNDSHRQTRSSDLRTNPIDKDKENIDGHDDLDDQFLTSISDFVTTIREKDNEIQNLLQSHQQDEVKIDGVSIKPKSVKFELHIEIQTAGQVSGVFDLQAKGSTKVIKIIQTLMPLFNREANPQYPLDELSSLVIYIKDLNIIIGPELRCMSLLSYKNQLKKSFNVLGFELYGIITTEEYAQMLYAVENKKREQSHIGQTGQNYEADDMLLTVTIQDLVNKGEIETIELDTDVSEKKDYDQNQDQNQDQDQSTSLVLSVMKNMSVSELNSLYRYKKKLPNQLRTQLYLNEVCLDLDKTLQDLNIPNDQILEIRYSAEELKELVDENSLNREADLDDVDNDDVDDHDDDHAVNDLNRKGTTDGGDNTGDNVGDEKEQYFSIFVAGADKKRFKVQVKPSTKLADITKFYLTKASLAPETKLNLIFDDEVLDLNQSVGDTELEDEFMIDVDILS